MYYERNISAVTSTPKDVTTAVDQTLTCTISDLDATHHVVVTWQDPAGGEVKADDADNYDLSAETVDASGVQKAVLTVKVAKLAAFVGQASFTYKCSVTSSQYSGSPSSTPQKDVVANVVTLGKVLYQIKLVGSET